MEILQQAFRVVGSQSLDDCVIAGPDDSGHWYDVEHFPDSGHGKSYHGLVRWRTESPHWCAHTVTVTA
jgi:hypothetical protein